MSASAFELLRRLPPGLEVKVTSDGREPLKGKVVDHPNKSIVCVFIGWDTWFEFTDQSDIVAYVQENPPRIHVH